MSGCERGGLAGEGALEHAGERVGEGELARGARWAGRLDGACEHV